MNHWILYHNANEEALTVLCSVIKHLGSGRALKKWGKTFDHFSCFPLHFFCALSPSACFKTKKSTIDVSLFVKELHDNKIVRLAECFEGWEISTATNILCNSVETYDLVTLSADCLGNTSSLLIRRNFEKMICIVIWSYDLKRVTV